MGLIGQAPLASNREVAAYSRVRGGARYTQLAAGRRRRRSVAVGVLAAILAAVLAGAGVAAASAVSFYRSLGERMNAGVTEQTKAVLADQQAAAQEIASDWTDTTPFYMLLLGVDSNSDRLSGEDGYGADESNYRSDTMILARIDPGDKKVTLVSIHRDTWVEIDGVYQKINSAFSIGGAAKTVEVVSEFAGVPITHYAEINLDGLYAVVDALGGVEVDVAYAVNDEYTGWTLDAGPQVLDGENAEVFLRSRHGYDYLGDGDRYRAANQRVFLAAVAKQLLAASPADMVSCIDTLADYITTDMTADQIVSLALAMRGMDADSDIYSTMNPTEAVIIDRIYYEISQDDYWHEIMAQVDAGERPDVDYAYQSVVDDINSPDHGTETVGENGMNTSASVVLRDASGAEGRLEEVRATLEGLGWAVSGSAEANLSLDSTVVVYGDAAFADDAGLIADQLGGSVEEAGDTWLMEGDVMVVVGAS